MCLSLSAGGKCRLPIALRTETTPGGGHVGLSHGPTWGPPGHMGKRGGLSSLVQTDQGQDGTEVSPGVSCCSLRTQGCLSALLLSVWSPGLKHRRRKGERSSRLHGVGHGAQQWLGHRHNTARVILRDAPAWGEAQLRVRKDTELEQELFSTSGDRAGSSDHGGPFCTFLQRGHHLGGLSC